MDKVSILDMRNLVETWNPPGNNDISTIPQGDSVNNLDMVDVNLKELKTYSAICKLVKPTVKDSGNI